VIKVTTNIDGDNLQTKFAYSSKISIIVETYSLICFILALSEISTESVTVSAFFRAFSNLFIVYKPIVCEQTNNTSCSGQADDITMPEFV